MEEHPLHEDEPFPEGRRIYRDCRNCNCKTENADVNKRCHCGAKRWTARYYISTVGRTIKVVIPENREPESSK